jgi:hypothetical protein
MQALANLIASSGSKTFDGMHENGADINSTLDFAICIDVKIEKASRDLLHCMQSAPPHRLDHEIGTTE